MGMEIAPATKAAVTSAASANSLSIIIPTIGRPTLRRTLESIRPQLGEDDEVIILCDMAYSATMSMHGNLGNWGFWDERYKLSYAQDAVSFFGHAQRNLGLKLATKHYVAFCGDDDVYDQNAFSVVRKVIAANPGRPLIFRVDTWSCGLVWRDPMLEVGNVDCGGFVIPNDKMRLGTFSYRYEGDYDFINGTLRGYPDGPVWRPERIQVCRPERYE